MVTYKTFETERLTLKPTSEDDAEFVFRLFNTPLWLQNIGDRNIKSIESAKTYIRDRIVPQYKRLGYSNYTIIRKSDNAKIGACGLYDREGLKGIDIGFALLPEYERMGYAFEAANKLKEMAFDEFGLSELSAITKKSNLLSQKLLEKLGLKLSGTIMLPNGDEKLLLYRTMSK